jgi:pyrimidine-nucleoside phosphorylase
LGTQMVLLAGLSPDSRAARALLEDRLHRGDALRTFADMVGAQGGDAGVIENPARLPSSPIQHPVPAPRDGCVTAVDAEALGMAAMRLGAGRSRADERIEPGAGLVLQKKIGDRVRRGESLAILHTAVAGRLDDAVPHVQAAYQIGAEAPDPRPLIVEILEAP